MIVVDLAANRPASESGSEDGCGASVATGGGSSSGEDRGGQCGGGGVVRVDPEESRERGANRGSRGGGRPGEDRRVVAAGGGGRRIGGVRRTGCGRGRSRIAAEPAKAVRARVGAAGSGPGGGGRGRLDGVMGDGRAVRQVDERVEGSLARWNTVCQEFIAGIRGHDELRNETQTMRRLNARLWKMDHAADLAAYQMAFQELRDAVLAPAGSDPTPG